MWWCGEKQFMSKFLYLLIKSDLAENEINEMVDCM